MAYELVDPSKPQIPEYVKGFINYPRETSKCELKPWINPILNEYDKVKIAKACISLKNHGGGVLLIGVKDNGELDTIPDSYDPTTIFTQDRIQAIISKYSAHLFEVDVHFIPIKDTKDSRILAIIVPEGITAPIMCKKNSPLSCNPKLEEGKIYTRTLGANGTVSSAPATQQDLNDITKKCLNNRTTDIGYFLRTHLTDNNLIVLDEVVKKIDIEQANRPIQMMQQFSKESKTKFIDKSDNGWMQITFKAPYNLTDIQPTRQWVQELLHQNPDLTGWPFFVDLWTPIKPEYKPEIHNGIWEAKLEKLEDFFKGIDYWRIDGKQGLFYAIRAFEDDLSSSNPSDGKSLDFVLVIIRTAEIIAIAIQFMNFLGKINNTDYSTFPLNIKWFGLQNRILASWVNPERSLFGEHKCSSDSVGKTVNIPYETTQNQIVQLTNELVGELFLNFNGWLCPPSVIEDLVMQLLNRKY